MRNDDFTIVIGRIPPTLQTPMHAPCMIPGPEDIDFPMLASEKINGVRNLGFPDARPISRTGCTWRNRRLDTFLADLQSICDAEHLVTDGEFIIPGLRPEHLQLRLNDRNGDLTGLQYKLFDAIDLDEYNGDSVTPFLDRHLRATRLIDGLDGVEVLAQERIDDWDTLCDRYRAVRRRGGEGLMIRRPDGLYRHGRCTMNERAIYKIKPLHANSKQTEIHPGLEV